MNKINLKHKNKTAYPITINWDFASEDGVTYTLVLPSGCIILENGNKNEEFRVSYTN